MMAMLRGACEQYGHRGCGGHGCRKKKDGSPVWCVYTATIYL